MNDSLNGIKTEGERFVNVATACFIGILLTIGLVGNSLVLYIYAYRFKASPFNIFIIFLAVMDFMFCALDMPLEIANMTHHNEFGGCKFVVTLGTVTAISTGQGLVAIAALRFNAVCRPLKQTISNKTARCLTVLFFIISCLVSWPPAVIMTNVHTRLDDNTSYVINCASSPEYVNTVYPLIYSMFQFLLFLGTFFSISVLYCITGSRLWKRKKYGIACHSTSKEFTSSTSSEKYFETTNRKVSESKSNDTIFSICKNETNSLDRTLKSNVINQEINQVKSNAGSQNLYDHNQQTTFNIPDKSSTCTVLLSLSNSVGSNREQTDKSTYDESNTFPPNKSSYDESNAIPPNESSCDESNVSPTNHSSSIESNTIPKNHSSNIESNTFPSNKSSCDESNTIPKNHSSSIESNTIPANHSSSIESSKMSKKQSCVMRSNSFPTHQSISLIRDSLLIKQSIKWYASFRRPSSNVLMQPNALNQHGHNAQNEYEYENPIYHEHSNGQNEGPSPISIQEQNLKQLSLDEFSQDQIFIPPPDLKSANSCTNLKESNANHQQKKLGKKNSLIAGSNKLDPVKMLVIMALIFFLSYVPHLSLMIYIEAKLPLKLVPVSESIIGIIIRSYFLGSVCNPILYGCYNRKFREEVKSIWKSLKRRIKR